MGRRSGWAGFVGWLSLLALVPGCSTWRVQERHERWTLHSEKGATVDAGAYHAAFEPAFPLVERHLGPFRGRVDVYVWSGAIAERAGGELPAESALVEEVPGIGPARVRAFHARGDGPFGHPTGIFVESPEPGTAVHELVHARLAEDHRRSPLWLEEGLACVLGDGYLDGATWVVDGLACWPWRALREQRLDDGQLAGLLAISAEERTSARDNVLVHFVGWAIVFDLYREAGGIDWEGWSERYARSIGVAEARERIERTLSSETLAAWLERLRDPRPEVRLATAKGLWKLRSEDAVRALIGALEDEEEPRVRIGLAVNALAAAGEVRLPRPAVDRLWRAVWPTLRRSKVGDPADREATSELLRSIRYGGGRRSQPALAKLEHYWSE